MLVDITLKITPKMATDAQGNAKITLAGHLGTHFDVMNKEFPLEYTKRKGVIFDVKHIRDRDIEASDIDMTKVGKDMFVGFYTGYIYEYDYGTQEYFATHPQLSDALIDQLLDAGISIIGLDCSGVRRGAQHTPKDQYCADRGVFVVENLYGLEKLLDKDDVTVNTYPMSYEGMSGLPCRVIAEV
ncbi:MAG: cyclase family protein [Oscillospiraceae bacterium]|nr:cyclase family protein [Oscillospiraceae bacterium]